ncbi:hypothetical protein BDV11DRAFT_186792 [Aspergillus similis]
MALSIAFQPQVLLGINTGINALSVDIDGGIGAFSSLPNLSLNVSTATGVDVLASTAWDLPTACVGFELEKATSKAGIGSAADAEGDGDNGDDSGDGGNGAVSLGGSGITLLCTLILSTVAAGFCSWG